MQALNRQTCIYIYIHYSCAKHGGTELKLITITKLLKTLITCKVVLILLTIIALLFLSFIQMHICINDKQKNIAASVINQSL